jgi:uncharacterized membrane protein
MGKVRPNKLAKRFSILFWIWTPLIACMAFCIFYRILSKDADIASKTSESVPIWASILVGILGIIGSYTIVPVTRFEFQRKNNETPKQYRMMMILMVLSIIVLFFCIITITYFTRKTQKQEGKYKCTSLPDDPTLFKTPLTTNSSLYVIAGDSIVISGSSKQDYLHLKKNLRKKILDKCDDGLLQSGYPAMGKDILTYISDPEQYGAVIADLTNRYFLLIKESVYNTNDICYFKATICLAKDRSLDSLVDVVYAKQCMQRALNKIITDSAIIDNRVSTSFSEIIQSVCQYCPSTNRIVQEIKRHCPNISTCDSIYFESGQYGLSIISRLLIESLAVELQKEKGKIRSVEFHGFTDPHGIPIPYAYIGNAHVGAVGQLLPDTAIITRRLETITDNEDLSFARAYSCYEYMKVQFVNPSFSCHYTGMSVSTYRDTDDRQRTVKIIINLNN